jgi:putrescine transport system ATP-binding protein
VYETPNCRFVADFIGSVNLFEGRVSEDAPGHVVVDTPECRHWVSHGITGTGRMPVAVAVRPEKIALQAAAPAIGERASPAEHGFNCVAGDIETISYFGIETLYHLRLASGMLLKVLRTNAARHEELRFARGQHAHAWWDGSDIVVLAA